MLIFIQLKSAIKYYIQGFDAEESKFRIPYRIVQKPYVNHKRIAL